MSLATRCPSCGTIFRVVQDQLKVCEGWVRCGRCDEVFSALVGLFDLQRDPPPDWSPGATLPTDAPDAQTEVAASPAPHIAEPPWVGDVSGDADFERLPQASAVGTGDIPSDVTADTSDTAAELPPDGVTEDAPAPPGFMRHAQRQARWQRPAVRAALGVAALALLLLLAGQAAHHFRDGVAAHWPGARPVLTAWCGMADCTIEAPKHLADISVESSALNRAAAPNAFKLALTLRNRGKLALTLPAVELSLTDATGQLVARRALMPRDFLVASPVLAAGAEAPLQLVLSAGSPRVTGYTVELFYP